MLYRMRRTCILTTHAAALFSLSLQPCLNTTQNYLDPALARRDPMPPRPKLRLLEENRQALLGGSGLGFWAFMP